MTETTPFEAAVEEGDERTYRTVTILGKRYRALPPKTRLMLRLAAQFADTADDDDEDTGNEFAAALNARFDDILAHFHEEDRVEIERRLDDPREVLDITHVMAAITRLAGDAAGRPTPPSSGSRSSRATTGRKSTAPVRAKGSTRSRSPRTASST